MLRADVRVGKSGIAGIKTTKVCIGSTTAAALWREVPEPTHQEQVTLGEPVHIETERGSLVVGLAPLVTVLIWSGNTVVTKAASGLISPGSISFYRWCIAFLLLLPFVARATWDQRHVVAVCWWKLALLGALGMVVYQSLAYVAAATTSAVNMGVIQALMPLTSAMFAALLASERLTGLRITGGAVSLAGLVYLTSRGEPSQLLAGGLHLGDGLMLVAILANSLYGVLLSRWKLPLTMWQQLLCQIFFAILLLLPIWLAGPISPITTANLPLILFAAIPTSLLAPLCWMISIRRLGAGRTALFVNLLPVMVALFAWAGLGEQLRAYHVIGGALALAGVAIGLAGAPLGKGHQPAAAT